MAVDSGLPRPIEALTAAALLVLSAPLLLVISVAVAAGSGLPVLFRQRRVGRGGREFEMLKFRTMKPNSQTVQVTATGDGRVTAVGRVLRRLKLDELPELVNVLRGDLALVGHRPEVPRYVDLEDPLWSEVLRERPGITHPVTLRLHREERMIASAGGDPEKFYVNELLPFKLRGYIEYRKRRSFSSDLEVLAATAAAMVGWHWYPAVRLEEVGAPPADDEGQNG